MAYKEGLTDLLFAMLESGRNSYRFRQILRERELKRYKGESIRVGLYRLKKKGYLDYRFEKWSLTQKGREYSSKSKLSDYLPSPFKKENTDRIIIAFDIPEKERKKRNWLRNQIKIFGYKMLQQSLWIGPGPLPDDFLKRLKDLKIREKVKTLRIANPHKN